MILDDETSIWRTWIAFGKRGRKRLENHWDIEVFLVAHSYWRRQQELMISPWWKLADMGLSETRVPQKPICSTNTPSFS